MRVILVLIFLFYSSAEITAHAYYFSFAEIQYNQQTACLEISIKVASHDLEDYFRKKVVDMSLEKARRIDSISTKINQLILAGFVIKQDNHTIELTIQGYENTPDGFTYFYLTSAPLFKEKETILTYDLFMDLYPEQQQKVTLLGKKMSTYQFMLFQREQLLNFNEL